MSTRFAAAFFLGMLFPIAGMADRSGNFEISVQPVNMETSEVTDRGSHWVEKEKSQTLVYKVKIDMRGLEKLENLEVQYIVAYKIPRGWWRSSESNEKIARGTQFIRAKKEVKQLAPLEKFEFNTEGIENSYREDQWSGGRNQYGKATLKGVTIRIMQGDKKLAEMSNPTDMKDAWDNEDAVAKKSGD